MESFRCYDNSDVIATLMMTNFHLNTTVVAIFPNVCLWRRSLCSDSDKREWSWLSWLGIDSEKLFRATFICQDGLCCYNMALISFRLFRKNLGNLRDFFGQVVYRPPWQKISRTPMRIHDRKIDREQVWLNEIKAIGPSLSITRSRTQISSSKRGLDTRLSFTKSSESRLDICTSTTLSIMVKQEPP